MSLLEKLESIYKETTEFSNNNIGMKYGKDFSEFVSQIQNSEQFKTLVTKTIIGSMLLAITPPKNKEDLLDSPIVKEMIAFSLYLGYKLGKSEGEIEIYVKTHKRNKTHFGGS